MKLIALSLVLTLSSVVLAEDEADVKVRELKETIKHQKQEIEKLTLEKNRISMEVSK